MQRCLSQNTYRLFSSLSLSSSPSSSHWAPFILNRNTNETFIKGWTVHGNQWPTWEYSPRDSLKNQIEVESENIHSTYIFLFLVLLHCQHWARACLRTSIGHFRGGLGDSVSDKLAASKLEKCACVFDVSLAMVWWELRARTRRSTQQSHVQISATWPWNLFAIWHSVFQHFTVMQLTFWYLGLVSIMLTCLICGHSDFTD